MTDTIRYDTGREAYIIEGTDVIQKYRLVVSREMLDDEVGEDVSPEAREVWIRDNLHNILTAYTSRHEGGWVKSPWDRVLVEEID